MQQRNRPNTSNKLYNFESLISKCVCLWVRAFCFVNSNCKLAEWIRSRSETQRRCHWIWLLAAKISFVCVCGCVKRCVFVFDIAMLIAYSDRLLYLVFKMKCTNKCDLYAWHANLTSLLHFKRALEFVTCLCSIAFYILCLFLLLLHARNLT